jgi:hypothetical protein
MGRGRPRKIEVTDRPKSVEDYAQENGAPAPETVRPVVVEKSTVAKFRGVGTVLVDGEVVAFRHGEYATESTEQAARLEKAGFERLA